MLSGQFLKRTRRGASNSLIVIMAGIIILLLVVLIVVYLNRPPEELRKTSGVRAGETVESDGLPAKRNKAEPIGDPSRVKEVLQPGKTYTILLKGGFICKCEDTDWGITAVTNIGFAAEAQISRKIESNDGQRITEVRNFDKIQCTKVLSEVEAVSINLGVPGMIMLRGLDYIEPGAGASISAAIPIAESFLKFGIQQSLEAKQVKAFGFIDTLQGKSVRVVYDDKRAEVIAITPLNADLTSEQLTFIREFTLAADCYIMPNTKSKPGDAWAIAGHAFSDFIDPSLKSVPAGSVNAVRTSDTQRGSKTIANLEIRSGSLQLLSTKPGKSVVGSFAPRGKLQYNVTDGFTEQGDLKGEIIYEELSTDHLLFPAKLRYRPTYELNYHCEMR